MGNKQEIYIQLLNVYSGMVYIYGHPKYPNSLRDALFFLDPLIRSSDIDSISSNSTTTSSSSSSSSSSSKGGNDSPSAAYSTHAATPRVFNQSLISVVSPPYRPTQWRYQVQDVASSETKNFVRLLNLPAGDHVLTIMTDRMDPRAVAGFCHLITF